jgi:S1-C subfamily serine protease
VQLSPALVEHAKLPVDKGLLVSQVTRGGLAEQAGLRAGATQARYGNSIIYLGGDIITEVDGMKVDSRADLYSALEDNKPGEKIVVLALRGGKTVSMTVTLADREALLE